MASEKCRARFDGPRGPIRCDLEAGHLGNHLARYAGRLFEGRGRDLRWPRETDVGLADRPDDTEEERDDA